MSALNLVKDEVKECPLCSEILEGDDVNFFPCACLLQVCRFCWHRLRTDGIGCPACWNVYSEVPAEFSPVSQKEKAALKAKKRYLDQQRKQKIYENKRHLTNMRILQKNLVVVVGLPLRLADSKVLKKDEFFGKFGRVQKVIVNQTTSYAGPQGPSATAYVTYLKSIDALRAIKLTNNILIDGRRLKARLGFTKYCSQFIKNIACRKQGCIYLHKLDTEASFTKEDIHQGRHQEYERKLYALSLEKSCNKSDRCASAVVSNDSDFYQTQLVSDNVFVVPPPLVSSQSKEVWPSSNTNISCKLGKFQNGKKQLTQCNSSKTNNSELSEQFSFNNSLQSGSSGDRTPESCRHSNDYKSFPSLTFQKIDTWVRNERLYKEELSQKVESGNFSDHSEISNIEDKLHCSTPLCDEYLNTDRHDTNSVQNKCLNDDSLCEKSSLTYNNSINIAVKDLNHTSVSHDSIIYTKCTMSTNSNFIECSDNTIDSSNDYWQSELKFLNPMNQRLHKLNSSRIVDSKLLIRNEVRLNKQHNIPSDVGDHPSLDEKLYKSKPITNDVSRFLMDCLTEKNLENTNAQELFIVKNGCGEPSDLNFNRFSSSDDDLGFDPFEETQKAFASMDLEEVLKQSAKADGPSSSQQQLYINCSINMSTDWAKLDPAIVSSSWTPGHNFENRYMSQLRTHTHDLNSINCLNVAHPSNDQVIQFGYKKNPAREPPQYLNTSSYDKNTDLRNTDLNNNNKTRVLPIPTQSEWDESERAYYATAPWNRNRNNFKIWEPLISQKSTADGTNGSEVHIE